MIESRPRDRRRALVELALFAALAFAGAVVEHFRGGLERTYLAFLITLAGPIARRALAARGTLASPGPAMLALELAPWLGLLAYPFSTLGLLLSSIPLVVPLPGRGEPGEAPRALRAGVVAIGLGALAIAWQATRSEPGVPWLAVCALVVVLGVAGARGVEGVVRGLGSIAVIVALAAVQGAWHPLDLGSIEPESCRRLTAGLLAARPALAVAGLVARRGLVALGVRESRAKLALIVIALELGALELGGFLFYGKLVSPEDDHELERVLERRTRGGSYTAFEPAPYTCFDLVPDLEAAGTRWHTHDGFRLPEMPRARRAGVFRIAVLGGSTVYENETPVELTFVAYLEELLNRSFPGHPIEVLNAAVGGTNSADNFGRFHFKVLDYAPDMVVSCEGGNDVWPMLCPGPFENDLRHARKVMEKPPVPGPLASFLCRHSWFFRACYFEIALGGTMPGIMQLTYKRIDVSGNTYAANGTSSFRRNLEDEAFICKGRGIDFVISTTPFEKSAAPERNQVILRASAELNAVVHDVAKTQGLGLIDLDAEMPRNEDPAADAETRARTWYFADNVHTTLRGNRARANLVGRALVKRLEPRFGVAAVPFAFDLTPAETYPPAHLER